jgi:hypothetical protein
MRSGLLEKLCSDAQRGNGESEKTRRSYLFCSFSPFLLGFCCLIGCGVNPLALILIPAHVLGYGDKVNIKFNFPDDAKKVAVVVHMPTHNQVDVGHFDRDVNNVLAKKIADYTQKKPDVYLAGKVHKWLDEHHDWKTPYDIGRGLHADHVVFIEMRKVSFFERDGWTHVYKGSAEVSVGVYRIGNDADEAEPIFGPETMTIRFPNTIKPIYSDDVTVSQFREAFVRHVAERLSWTFVPHASNLEYSDDNGM